jgi:predicted phosphate transport protein (TIGR00153 family)
MFLDRIVRFLLPRQDRFFVLLEQIGDRMVEAAAVFGELTSASGHQKFADVAGRLRPIERAADQVCHDVYAELDRSFVTPIDREDLSLLTKTLDDVVDAMEHAAAFAALYRFEALTDPMRQLIGITVKAVGELSTAIRNIRNFGDPDSIRGPTVAVHTLENEADVVYRNAVEALFADGTDTKELVRQKDMLFTLEDGVDRCEDAMDVIRSVVVKNG